MLSSSDSPTEQYIFDTGTELYFYDFLDSFHDKFVDELVMTGVTGVGLDSVMVHTTRDDFDTTVHDLLINEMQSTKPLVHIRFDDEVICNVYAIDAGEHACGVYMLQTVKQYPDDDTCMYCLWDCTNKFGKASL